MKRLFLGLFLLAGCKQEPKCDSQSMLFSVPESLKKALIEEQEDCVPVFSFNGNDTTNCLSLKLINVDTLKVWIEDAFKLSGDNTEVVCQANIKVLDTITKKLRGNAIVYNVKMINNEEFFVVGGLYINSFFELVKKVKRGKL